MIKTDICIIGAGPAGATASLFLAKMGIPHMIVDAAVFPRDKVCGDGLDLKVFRVLRNLDPSITPEEALGGLDYVKAWGARFIAPDRRMHDYAYAPKDDEPNYPIFWVSKRLHFDHFLVKKIDPRFADFRQGLKITDIRREGERWLLQGESDGNTLTIDAALIVGADGDHSSVLRAIGERKIDRAHYAGSVRQYWRGVTDFHPLQLIDVYFPSGKPWSYFWMFPLPNGETNVGFGMVSDIAAQGRHNIRNIFKEMIANDPAIAPRFRNAEPLEEPVGWGLPLASRRRRAFGDGYLLLGDAASLVCPTSGEGIGTAMMSGYIAAQFIRRAAAEKRFDQAMFTHFDREIYRRLESEIWQYQVGRRYMPWRLYEWTVNKIAPSPMLKSYYYKNAGSWLDTAYRKPIEVSF